MQNVNSIFLSLDIFFLDFETAMNGDGQLPRHESIIQHHFNVELFHSDDLGNMDTIGWITVMDYGDYTLRDILRAGNLSLKARKDIYGKIVSGYEYLGSVGLTYNDLKPENIIIFPNTLKIIDYGLATDRDVHLFANLRKMRCF